MWVQVYFTSYNGVTQKYCLVKLLEPLNEGDEFTAINYWPLHITLASNFVVEWETTDLFNKLSVVLSDIQPVSVSAGDDEFFGGGREIQVTVMNMTPELMTLHKQIIKTFKDAGAVFDERNSMRTAFAPTQLSKKRTD